MTMARFRRRAAIAAVTYISMTIGLASATSTPECSADSASESCKASKDADTNNHFRGFNEPNQCALFLAPSTLPKANLGIFSGVKIPVGSSANEFLGGAFAIYSGEEDMNLPMWNDLYVPVEDEYKTLPYRGQQLFPSWLAYIYPREPGAFFNDDVLRPMPSIPRELWAFDEGFNHADSIQLYSEVWDDNTSEDENWDRLKVNAFTPGILALVNSHPFMDNLEMTYDNMEKDETDSGAFTPHHGIAFQASKTVYSGMELFLNYGAHWHSTNHEKMASIKYTESSELSRQKKGFVEGIPKKWDVMIENEIDQIAEQIPTEKARRESLKKGIAFSHNSVEGQPYSEYRENTYLDRAFEVIDNDTDGDDDRDLKEEPQPTQVEDIVKPISWLKNNGVCLSSGMLYVGKSAILHAGRGVFANAKIDEGEVILTSPLIAMRREQFKIYLTDPDSELVSKTVDKTTVIGEELLLNYAFGHPESPMLLVPTAPMTNFINHGKEPNVKIRWPGSQSNAAKIFNWVFRNHGHLYSKYNENDSSLEHNPWLKMHPIDVMERSGKIGIEYEAMRPIQRNEEILIDYGPLWEEAWKEYIVEKSKVPASVFRHYIQVPTDLYPPNWLNVSGEYEIAETKDLKNKPLEPGKVMPLTWAHNGRPVSSKNAYVVGLPQGFSDKFLEHAENEGVIQLARRLLREQDGYALPIDGFQVFNPHDLGLSTNATKEKEYFGHRYQSRYWGFNMHYIGAWNELTRKSLWTALGDEGFDLVLQGIGERFGYDNITCFHALYMAISFCDQSKLHLDTWATGDKSWNLFFPVLSVERSEPELDIFSDDMNTAIGVNYLKDVVYAIGDHGYHQSRPTNNDYDPQSGNKNVPLRVTFNAYCAHIDETNIASIRHIYEEIDASPFMDQFIDASEMEIHWDRSGTSSLKNPGGG